MPWRITGTVLLKDGTDRREELPEERFLVPGVKIMTDRIVEELDELTPDESAGVKITITAEKT